MLTSLDATESCTCTTQSDSATGSGATDNKPASTRGVDRTSIEAAVRQILRAVGEDPHRPGLQDTPARVARMYEEMFAGLRTDPARHLKVTFPESYDEMVLVRDISFNSMCEHHLLPFNGVAHVAYIPNGRVTGLSKLARVVDEVARRPQVQERMTQTIADMLESELQTTGAAVVVEAEHSCMSIRGIRKQGSLTVTSALRGIFRTNQSSRAEVMALINK
jgi:GTP cyclohydrolase I